MRIDTPLRRLPDLTIPVVVVLMLSAYCSVTWLRGGDVRWRTAMYAALIVAATPTAFRLFTRLFVTPRSKQTVDED